MKLHERQLALLRDYISQQSSGQRSGLLAPTGLELAESIRNLPEAADMSNAEVLYAVRERLFNADGTSGMEAATDPEAALNAVVARVVDFLKSIPRSYLLTVKLPAISMPDLGYEIAPGVDLVSSNLSPPAHLGSAVSNVGSVVEGTSLRIRIQGYYHTHTEPAMVDAAVGLLKQCTYLLLAFEVLKKGVFQPDRIATASIQDSHTLQSSFIGLPEGLQRYLSRLALAGNVEPETGLLQPARLTASQFPPKWMADGLSSVRTYFLNAQTQTSLTRVSAAMEWLVDAESGTDQTMGYLAACIGVESLLGEETEPEVHTSRLADRYSYMLGQTREQRAKLAGEFLEAFKTRGKIVHARRTRLAGKDLDQLRSIFGILRNLLLHEVRTAVRHPA